MARLDVRKFKPLERVEPEFLRNICLVYVYDYGHNALIVDRDDNVYKLRTKTLSDPIPGEPDHSRVLKKIEVLCQKGVKTFAHGDSHNLALTKSGTVYSWRQKGEDSTPYIVCLHPDGKDVVGIACGNYHSLALTDEGEVFAWGKSRFAQHGRRLYQHLPLEVVKPTRVRTVLAGEKIVSIACGEYFSMALTHRGEVYSWGDNRICQLGLGHSTNKLNPKKVTALDSIFIEKIVCGGAHTLALSDQGALYAWGSNRFGQLGVGDESYSDRPVQVAGIGRVYDIAAEHLGYISVAIDRENRVYVWGLYDKQRLTEPVLSDLAHPHDVFARSAGHWVMHQQETPIVECLKNAFDDPMTSDLVIQVQGIPIHVHKSVLKIRCQHFRNMFQEHWAENSKNILHLDQYSHEVYKSFLEYLYTDEVHLPVEKAFELLNLANYYCEDQLQRRCVRIIKHGITVENGAFLYGAAIKYHDKVLEEFCFKFALDHMTAFVQTTNFANLDELIRQSFFMKAAQAGLFKT